VTYTMGSSDNINWTQLDNKFWNCLSTGIVLITWTCSEAI
jgi:hypothetical protein